MPTSEVVELEEISICPECGSRLFEIVETISSDGPYCRCSQCKWHALEGNDAALGSKRTKRSSAEGTRQ